MTDTDSQRRELFRATTDCRLPKTTRKVHISQRQVANFAPDAVVLTNRRAIIFRQKMLGQLEILDCTWLHVSGIHMKENLIGATVSVQGHSGHVEVVDYLPKVQARRVYRIGQEMEEEMIERRQQRKMEEAQLSHRDAACGSCNTTSLQHYGPRPTCETLLVRFETSTLRRSKKLTCETMVH